MEQDASSRKEPFRLLPYVWLVLGVGALAYVSNTYGKEILHTLSHLEEAPSAPILETVALIAICSFISFYATRGTPIPSFVVAIALGIAGHELFAPVVADRLLLSSLVTGLAALILFGGGLEMPLGSFLRLFVKVALLAVPGVLITGAALSFVVAGAGDVFGFAITPTVVILLGAILASTDPAAIIPVLQGVQFKRREAKDIVIAESALNDVVGALLTTVFLAIPLGGLSILAAYQSLASVETAEFLGYEALYGVLFGVGGYLLLAFLSQIKRRDAEAYGADQLFFLGAPFIAFVGAAAFHGSGFLAAFIAGLLFHAREHLAGIEHFFNQVIDGVAKPIIFLLVGALVDLNALITYAPIGIAVGLLFMFVIRPAMVFLMLGIFSLLPSNRGGLTRGELLFISFVRETGAIPAVLLVTAVSTLTTPVAGLVEIGMWVILLTLIIQPPLTPFMARKLSIAD
ncbi:MAG: cation:proton antiporter [Alphaproteobacteria bacterium]